MRIVNNNPLDESDGTTRLLSLNHLSASLFSDSSSNYNTDIGPLKNLSSKQ